MRTLIFYILVLILIGLSGFQTTSTSGSVQHASKEIVTLISILSAAVISCIFSVSKTLNLVQDETNSTFLFFVRDYWVKFFIVCAFCATVTILGNILEWPSVYIQSKEIDLIGFFSLSSLSFLVVMMFLDFPVAIRDMLYTNPNEQTKDELIIQVPEFSEDDNFGKIST